jgi:hypothetical protein
LPGHGKITDLPDVDTAAILLRGAIEQIRFARDYTLGLLEATPQDRWWEMPEGLPTHIAWQVGHLTVSQYGLLMFRMRGRRPEDLELIPGVFRKAYSRQSVPLPHAERTSRPTADDLMDRMNQVHEQSITELEQLDPSVLLQPVDMPYAAYPIKLGAVLFCPLHEQIHCGQIGLLRRALGLPPVR